MGAGLISGRTAVSDGQSVTVLLAFLDSGFWPILNFGQIKTAGSFTDEEENAVLRPGTAFRQDLQRIGAISQAQVAARNEKVIREFDRAKQRMYRRYERTDGIKAESDKDLTYSQYYAWLDAATEARDQFLRGEITEAEALRIIIVP